MGHRNTVLAVGEIYHIFNRSTHKIPIFQSSNDCDVFLESSRYYLQKSPKVKFSSYRKFKHEYTINLNDRIVTILNYCLMPNHYHFTLRQEVDNGIRTFIQKLTGSYSHYYNKKSETNGALFSGNFKAARVIDENQLLHLSRYIHLNPVTDRLVDSPEKYQYSSYNIYLGNQTSEIVETDLIMKNIKSKDYEKFVLDQKDYQRELASVKNMILE